jgi:hypothetical protein
MGCTHVVGSYWVAWPTTFLSLIDPAGPVIWAVTHRAGPTAPQWKTVASPKWCAPMSDPTVDESLRAYALEPALSMQRAGDFDVLTLGTGAALPQAPP